jgi:topoisomerase-4 subunit A
MKELRDWRGKRADAGRIAPKGFPKNNKFVSLVTKNGRKADDTAEEN